MDYAFDEAELVAKVEHALLFGEVILQDYVAGDGVGVELLAHHGEVLFAFQHLRLHEVPLTGGGSSFRKSVALTGPLLEAAKSLISELHWHGVAMVEFKYDPGTGANYLMEINGRFWGSLPLAVAAGADFPGMLFDMLVDGRRDFEQSYKEEVYCRRLTSDVHWYELALRRAAPERLNVIPTRRQMFADLLKLFSLRHRFDIQSFSDPVPGLVELVQLVRSYADRLIDVLNSKWFLYRQSRRWRNGDAIRRLRGARDLLFVCYGNINRSAVAEVYARKIVGEAGLTVDSAGFHGQGGRAPDEVMVGIAAAAGVKFNDFSSTTLTAEQVSRADVILVMEESHYRQLVEKFPWARDLTYLLGGADGSVGSSIVIEDPYGKSPEQYHRCFDKVCNCVGSLLSSIRGVNVQP